MTSHNHVFSSNYVLLQAALSAQGAMFLLITGQPLMTSSRVPRDSGELDRKPRVPTRVCVPYPDLVTRVVIVSVANVTVSQVAQVTSVTFVPVPVERSR